MRPVKTQCSDFEICLQREIRLLGFTNKLLVINKRLIYLFFEININLRYSL